MQDPTPGDKLDACVVAEQSHRVKDDGAFGCICSHKPQQKKHQVTRLLSSTPNVSFVLRLEMTSFRNAKAPKKVRLTESRVDVEGDGHVSPTFLPPAGPEGAVSCVPRFRLGHVALFETSCSATENILLKFIQRQRKKKGGI